MTGGTGNCVLTAEQGGDADYAAALDVQRTVVAQKRDVTVTADPKSKVYGDPDPALTSQITSGSLVGGDNFSGALTRDGGETVVGSPYAITQGTLALDTSDYNLSYVGADLTITPKALTVSGADAEDKTYDGDTDAAIDLTSATLGGVVGADVVTADDAAATFNNKNVGTAKPVSVSSVTLGGADADNYTATPPAGLAADITAKDTAGSFTAADKVYNGITPRRSVTQPLGGRADVFAPDA